MFVQNLVTIEKRNKEMVKGGSNGQPPPPPTYLTSKKPNLCRVKDYF